MTEPRQGGMPSWVFGVCGCLLAGILLIVGIAAVGFVSVKRVVEDMSDPESRESKALAMLGADQMPTHYRSALALRIPFILDMVVLYDETALAEDVVVDDAGSTEGGSIEEGSFDKLNSDDFGRAFFYLLVKVADDDEDPWDLEFRIDEQLASGELSINGQKIHYSATRGHPAGEDDRSLIVAEMTIECPDQRRRKALWFETIEQRPVPDDLTGSPADEQALEQMMSHFRVCTVDP